MFYMNFSREIALFENLVIVRITSLVGGAEGLDAESDSTPLKHLERSVEVHRCRATMAHIRQSRLSFKVKKIKTFQVMPSSLESGRSHPGGNPGAIRKSISHRCYLWEVAFEWEFTKETIYLPLGCLRGGGRPEAS